MKKILIYILIFLNISIMLSGCATNRKKVFIFTGESSIWAVQYTVDVVEKTFTKEKNMKYNNLVDRELKITLKDKNIKSEKVNNMKFSLKSSSREASGDINFEDNNDKGSIFIKSSQVNASFENESDIVDIKIYWNDKEENISLKLDK